MTWPTKRQRQRQTQWQWQKFRVWPLIHCYESDSSRPNWWGLTKFHNFRQISQFWPISQFQPNFTILKYLRYLEYLELGQFRNLIFAMFLTSIGPLLFYPLPFPHIPQFFLLYFPNFSFSLFSKSEDGAQWSLFPDWSSHHPPADNGVRKPTTLDKTKVRMGGRILKKERVMLVFRGLPQIKIKPTEAIREVFNGCDEFKGFE